MLLPGSIVLAVDIAFSATDPFDTGPAFTSVVSSVLLDHPITATLGGSDIAGTAEVGRLSIAFKNSDGTFSPDNTSSIHYPNLVADRPVQIRLNTLPVFTGYVEQWDDNIGIPGVAVMTAQCPLGLLARYSLSGIGLRNFVVRHPSAPTSYFRLGTRDGVELFDEISGRTRGQYHDYHTAAEGLALSDPDDSAEMLLGIPSFVGVYGDDSPAGAGAFAIQLIVNTRSLPSAATTNEIWELDSVTGTLCLRINDVGALALLGPGGIAVPGPTIAIDTPTVVAVRRASNGTSWAISAQTASQLNPTVATGTSVGYTIPAGTALHVGGGASVGPDWNGQIDELLVWRNTDPGNTVLADIGRRMIYGLPQMTASARSAYMVQEAGFDASRHSTELVSAASDPVISGQSLPSGSVLADIQKTADTVAGDFYSRPDGDFVHRGYRIAAADPTTVLTFNDQATSPQIPYSNLVVWRPFSDNRTVVEATDGTRSGQAFASLDTAAPLPKSVTVHPITPDFTIHRRMAIIAQRFLRKLVLASPRVRFTVSLTHLDVTQRAAVLTNLIRGTSVSIVHHPRSGGTKTYSAGIIKASWSIGADGVSVAIETQPARVPWATAFRWTNQADRSVSSGLTDIVPLSPRFDSDGHGDAQSVFTEIALIPGPTDADESVYLVGGCVYWDEHATGIRYFQIDDAGSGSHWAISTDQGSATTTNGNVLGAVTLLRQSDVNEVRATTKQTSGVLLDYRGSGFPTTNEAFGPDLWGVRLPTDAHSCRLTRTTNQTLVTPASADLLLLNSERWDPAGLHSTVSNTSRITPTRTGLYLFGTSVAFDVNATGSRRLGIHPSGSATPRGLVIQQGLAGEYTCLTCLSLENITSLAGGPYWETRPVQFSAGSLDVVKADFFSPEFWCLECSGPGARMRWTGSGSNGSGAWVQTASFTSDFDTDGLKSGDAFVLSEDGYWFVYASSPEFALHATGTRGVEIRRGGHEVVSRKLIKSAAAAAQSVQTGDLIEGRAGDVLRAYSWQDSGGLLTAIGTGDYAAVFACVKVSDGG